MQLLYSIEAIVETTGRFGKCSLCGESLKGRRIRFFRESKIAVCLQHEAWCVIKDYCDGYVRRLTVSSVHEDAYEAQKVAEDLNMLFMRLNPYTSYTVKHVSEVVGEQRSGIEEEWPWRSKSTNILSPYTMKTKRKTKQRKTKSRKSRNTVKTMKKYFPQLPKPVLENVCRYTDRPENVRVVQDTPKDPLVYVNNKLVAAYLELE